MQATLRVAELRDAAAVAAVQVASWQTTYPGIVAQAYIDRLSVAERTIAWERRFRGEGRPAPDTIVAEAASGGLVGFASGGPIREPHPGFDAELHAIYLLKEVQGHGLGRCGMAGMTSISSRPNEALHPTSARHFWQMWRDMEFGGHGRASLAELFLVSAPGGDLLSSADVHVPKSFSSM